MPEELSRHFLAIFSPTMGDVTGVRLDPLLEGQSLFACHLASLSWVCFSKILNFDDHVSAECVAALSSTIHWSKMSRRSEIWGVLRVKFRFAVSALLAKIFPQICCRHKARMSPLSKAEMSASLPRHRSWESVLGVDEVERAGAAADPGAERGDEPCADGGVGIGGPRVEHTAGAPALEGLSVGRCR